MATTGTSAGAGGTYGGSTTAGAAVGIGDGAGAGAATGGGEAGATGVGAGAGGSVAATAFGAAITAGFCAPPCSSHVPQLTQNVNPGGDSAAHLEQTGRDGRALRCGVLLMAGTGPGNIRSLRYTSGTAAGPHGADAPVPRTRCR